MAIQPPNYAARAKPHAPHIDIFLNPVITCYENNPRAQMGIKMDYKNTDYPTLSTRDRYLSWSEIDMRQLAELRSLMDRWKQGLSVWEVMWEFEYIMDVWAFSNFNSALRTESYQKEEDIQNRRRRLTPHIRPSFLEAPLSDETLLSIDSLCQQMEDRPDLNSFDFAESIARAVLLESEGPPEPIIPTNPTPWDTLTEPPESNIPLDTLLKDLRRVRLRKTKQSKAIVGSLRPRSEAEFTKPLDPYIQRMRKGWEYEGYPQLIKAMTVDASGSGDIKPFRFNSDHLPPEWQPTKRDGLFDPYATDAPKAEGLREDVYGTKIAVVTTYSISFEPCSADQLKDLAAKVELAVKLIGIIPPTFGIPTDYESRPYKRPFFPANNPNDIKEPKRAKISGSTRDYSETPLTLEQRNNLIRELRAYNYDLEDTHEHWGYGRPMDVNTDSFASCDNVTSTHCDVGIKDGRVEIFTRLDLDDTFRLYYLLEHLMVPSIETARALNAARFMEARSAPQRKDGLRSGYSTDHIPAHEQVGHLAEKRPDEILPAILQAAKNLYNGGIISEEGLVEQVLAATTHTVLGTIADPSGVFPSYDRLLTDGRYEEKYGLPITLQQAVQIRTRQFLRIIAGLAPDSPEPLGNALFQAKVGESESVRNQWRKSEEKELCRRFSEEASNCKPASREDLNCLAALEGDLSISDILTGLAVRNAEEEKRFGIVSKERQRDTGSRFSDLQKAASENNPNPITREVARIQLERLREQDDRQDRGEEAYEAWQAQIPAPRTGLVLRDPDVPPCADILYKGTIYTSRLKGSGLPRHELPTQLRKLLEPEADPYQSAVSLICLNPESEEKNPAPIEGRNPQP